MIVHLDEGIHELMPLCVKEQVVFTNGCFDLVHIGHLRYLEEARKYGTILIVGLNSDASVRGLKGDLRPIVPAMERAELLQALRFVDHVVIFEEETPLRLIQAISPQVLVKGGDWRVEQIVGSDHVLKQGGRVLSLNFVDGHSTSDLIDRVRERYQK